MDNHKRFHLKAFTSVASLAILTQWYKPIVNSVLLPVHAQMSQCVEENVLGLWDIDNNCTACTYTTQFELYADGTGLFVGSPPLNNSKVFWSLANNILTIDHQSDSETLSYVGALSQTCEEFSGTANGQVPTMFTGTKIN